MYRFVTAVSVLLLASPVLAGGFDSGSDGSDGAFNPQTSVQIDLSLADGTPGNGTYDPDLWAVVFNYTTIDIPSGVYVTFSNHPSGAPVVWLASGDVTLAGAVDLSGVMGEPEAPLQQENARVAAPSGPGGFLGGFGGVTPSTRFPSGGYGPGGPSVDPDGSGNGSGGSYRTVGYIGQQSTNVDQGLTYGNIFLLPLIGGSGGAGGWGTAVTYGAGGGGGGGAILIASSGIIHWESPTVLAWGGAGVEGATGSRGGGGAGGGIRLIANTVIGSGGTLWARGGQVPGTAGAGQGGNGRVRVEADVMKLTIPSGSFTSGAPGLVFPPLDAPTLVATMVGTETVPADPVADVEAVDVSIESAVPVTIQIEATNIPLGTTVDVRVVPKREGNSFVVTSTPLDGTLEFSTATAEVTFPRGVSDVQLSAWFEDGGGARGPTPPGEKDRAYASATKVKPETPRYRRVHAIVGVETGPGPNEMTYVTGDGRRVTYPADLFKSTRRILQAARFGKAIGRSAIGH